MADEPINVLSRRLSKFFTSNPSSKFDYLRYMEKQAIEKTIYENDQKTFHCVCLSHRDHSSPGLSGYFYDSRKISDESIKKSSIKIWFIGDDENLNGPNGNPFATNDEGLIKIYISLAEEAIVTKSFNNITFNSLLSVEKRGDQYYVVEHHHDQKDFLSPFTNFDNTQTASQVYSQSSRGLISKLGSFLDLPPIGEAANEIAAAYPKAKSFANKIVEVANNIGTNPYWLANLINFETATTFSPTIVNELGYTGLIQFGTKGEYAVIKDLGITKEQLLAMSADEQMEQVEKYFQLPHKRLGSDYSNPIDLYMAVFYPSYIGQPDRRFPNNVIAANNGIDTPREYARRANRAAKLPTGL